MDFFFCAVLAVVFSFLPTPAVIPRSLSLPVPFYREATDDGEDAADTESPVAPDPRRVGRRMVRDDNGKPATLTGR